MNKERFSSIDLIIVNFYPFQRTVIDSKNPNKIIENIDVGGPTMVRAAAKNFKDVTIITNKNDYQSFIKEIKKNNGKTSLKFRELMSSKAFGLTAYYDAMIANWFNKKLKIEFPDRKTIFGRKLQKLRYGENPHQQSSLYVSDYKDKQLGFTQLHGKDLSYNNYNDIYASLQILNTLKKNAGTVIIKHANPCGVAVATDIKTAYELAFATDPESAFGGIIAFNRELDAETAQLIVDKQFSEVIIAPIVSAEAAEAVSAKKNVRLLACGEWGSDRPTSFDYKRVNGGLLIQEKDNGMVSKDDLKVVTKVQPSGTQMDELLFAWKVAKMVKSNAIIYAKDGRTIGVGAGQMSRVNSARIAAIKAEHAGLEVAGAVMASDAFFPCRDGIDRGNDRARRV